jgi:hypothetical protein
VTTLRGNVNQGDSVVARFTIKATCSNSLAVSLVSYEAPGPTWDPATASSQQVFDSQGAVGQPGVPASIGPVLVPPGCFQIDFVQGGSSRRSALRAVRTRGRAAWSQLITATQAALRYSDPAAAEHRCASRRASIVRPASSAASGPSHLLRPAHQGRGQRGLPRLLPGAHARPGALE